jgi:hypothetical protein
MPSSALMNDGGEMGAQRTTLQTAFGSFVGGEENGVKRFLGIKYAKVKNWLAAPELTTGCGDEIVDVTGFG